MTESLSPEARLQELGLTLPPTLPPIANFAPALLDDGLLYLSGQGPRDSAGYRFGKVGADVSADEAREHAKLVGLSLLAVIRQELGSLDRVRRVVRLFGMVNATPDFVLHSRVIDGCSDLFGAIFGQAAGRHARSAVGVGSLPGNITVEIEAVVAVHP